MLKALIKFRFEGDGLQAVRKCSEKRAASAAEGTDHQLNWTFPDVYRSNTRIMPLAGRSGRKN
jgi:hypothetical protein